MVVKLDLVGICYMSIFGLSLCILILQISPMFEGSTVVDFIGSYSMSVFNFSLTVLFFLILFLLPVWHSYCCWFLLYAKSWFAFVPPTILQIILWELDDGPITLHFLPAQINEGCWILGQRQTSIVSQSRSTSLKTQY